MNFNELKVGQMLEYSMDNDHYFIISEKKGDNVKFLQFSISEKNIRFGYRSTTRKTWNDSTSIFGSLETSKDFSGDCRVVVVAFFEKEIRDLPTDRF